VLWPHVGHYVGVRVDRSTVRVYRKTELVKLHRVFSHTHSPGDRAKARRILTPSVLTRASAHRRRTLPGRPSQSRWLANGGGCDAELDRRACLSILHKFARTSLLLEGSGWRQSLPNRARVLQPRLCFRGTRLRSARRAAPTLNSIRDGTSPREPSSNAAPPKERRRVSDAITRDEAEA